MLLEELGKGRNGDVKGVGAIVLFQALQLGGTRNTPGGLELLELRLRLVVDVVDKGAKGL
jgi:hypothetical protein